MYYILLYYMICMFFLELYLKPILYYLLDSSSYTRVFVYI